MDREDYEKAIRELDQCSVGYGPDLGMGWQLLVRLPNNYGASIIQNDLSRGHLNGLAEMAVIRWWGYGFHWSNWDFVDPSPIPSDTLGWLRPDDVVESLKQIMELPKARAWPYSFKEMFHLVEGKNAIFVLPSR